MSRVKSSLFGVLTLAPILIAATGYAQESSSEPSVRDVQSASSPQTPVDIDKSKVVGIVGEHSITKADVIRHVRRTIGTVRRSDTDLERELAAIPTTTLKIAIDHLVNRELAFQYLESNGFAAGKNEISLRAANMKKNLARTGQKMEDYLAEKGLTADQLRHEVAWEIGWRKFATRELTDDTLKSYFKTQRRLFDGTQLRVAHILWKVANDDEKSNLMTVNQVRQQVLRGEISWEQAAKEHSIAIASREQGGEIGWIQIDQPMATVFSDVAFQLDLNEISQPVVTTFGIHVIKCLEIKRGTKTFMEVMEQVRNKATTDLFLKVAAQQRATTKVEFFDH